MRFTQISSLIFVLAIATSVHADDADAKALIKQSVAAVGGEDKLLKLFRIKERLVLGSDPDKKAIERVSVLEPPTYWWVGKKERVKDEKEPATFLVWAWTLAPLIDPKSKIEVLPEIKEGQKPAYGLRVSETITPPMDLYFDKVDRRLIRIDWRKDSHKFSEWKEHDGVKYPTKVVGHKPDGKAWYFSEITEIERLKELPAGLKR